MIYICGYCNIEFKGPICDICGAVNRNGNWKKDIRPQKIVVICNYGMTRSKTMATCIKNYFNDKALTIEHLGVLNYNPKYLDVELNKYDKIIVCNKTDLDKNFEGNQHQQREEITKVINENHKDKLIICETIGEDIWQKPFHPKLMAICKRWIKENEGVLIK